MASKETMIAIANRMASMAQDASDGRNDVRMDPQAFLALAETVRAFANDKERGTCELRAARCTTTGGARDAARGTRTPAATSWTRAAWQNLTRCDSAPSAARRWFGMASRTYAIDGNVIKHWLIDSGMTRKQLAADAGISDSTLTHAINENRNCGIDILLNLSLAMDIEPWGLVREMDPVGGNR